MAGLALLAPLITTGLQYAMQGEQNQNQLNQQGDLDAVQASWNESQAEYGMNLQEQLWNYTGYQGQVKQLNAAGLNPALLYGKGSSGGQTAAIQSVGQAPGAQAPQGTNNPLQGAQMGIDAAQAMADISLKKHQEENIDADTQKKQAEVPNINASTDSTLQGINNLKAQETLTQAQVTGQNISNYINENSSDNQIEMWKEQVAEEMGKATSAMVKSGIDQQMISTNIGIIRNTYLAGILQNNLTKAQTDNTKASTAEKKSNIEVNQSTIQKMAADIAQGWQGLDNAGKIMKVQAVVSEYNAQVAGQSEVQKDALGIPFKATESMAKQIDIIMGISPKDFKNVPIPQTNKQP